MSDNFDLKKFLKESKALENLNPIMHNINNNSSKKTLNESFTKSSLRDQIREMVLAEMEGGEVNESYTDVISSNNMDYEEAYGFLEDQGLNQMEIDSILDQVFPDINEAKKDEDEDEEEIDAEEIDAEEIDVEVTDEEEPTSDVELAAAGATGDSKELINHLMSSLETAKAMGNEKLTTQVMNTLKFAIDQSMA
jgi:hypothetical protein